jgi:hypothetical protein
MNEAVSPAAAAHFRSMNQLARSRIEFNRQSADQWVAFAEHRSRVTGLLANPVPGRASRLCVLGAGNCNDLDLAALLASHSQIHLVDLDALALDQALVRQGLPHHPGLFRYGRIDISGQLDALAEWSPRSEIGPEHLAAAREKPQEVVRSLPAPFDMVASTCLLSELLDAVVHSVGEWHPRFLELLQAVRFGHLRLLIDLIAPGGTGVLITDFVSSRTYPDLGSVPEDALPGVLAGLVRDRNFFHGLNPRALHSLFHTDPTLSAELAAVEAAPPWRWTLHGRVYAVYAFTLRRR